MISQRLDTQQNLQTRLACHSLDEQTASKLREVTPEINHQKIYQENNYVKSIDQRLSEACTIDKIYLSK